MFPTQSLAEVIVRTYPEESPFDMKAPPTNLTPDRNSEHDIEMDTPELVATALAQTVKTGKNPLYTWLGTNPLVIRNPAVLASLPPMQPESSVPPPPIPRAELDGPIQFLEQINPEGTLFMYKVRIGEDVRFLKVYPDRDPDEETDWDLVGMGKLRFDKEMLAYAHLIKHGVDKLGVIPRCYGWFELDDKDISSMMSISKINEDTQPLAHTRRPTKGVLFEYLDGEPLTIKTITGAIADRALRGLQRIHAAYVQHKDVTPHNIMVLPDDRVVWVDFDESSSGSDPHEAARPTRQSLLAELADTWNKFYAGMLPDKRIGCFRDTYY